MAFQAGRAPVVHTGEPILTAAGAAEMALHRLGVAHESGEETRQRSSVNNFAPAASPTRDQTSSLRHMPLQLRMMRKGKVIEVAQKKKKKKKV